MRLPILVHVVGGGLALVSGFVALYAAKGARTHRASGTLFVYAMLVMSLTGAAIAALHGTDGSVIAGVLTAYLVVTALTTVRTPAGWSRRVDVGLMVLALAVGLTSLALGAATVAGPTGLRDGLPPFPFFMFGIVGVLGGAGDLRVLRAGALRGAPRLRRHLWRMCWALWIAASSFFFGQAKVLPAAIRKPPLLAIPVLLVLVTMLWWLWRMRGRRRAPDVAAAHAAPASS
jgi:uncharacterized membrane protein